MHLALRCGRDGHRQVHVHEPRGRGGPRTEPRWASRSPRARARSPPASSTRARHADRRGARDRSRRGDQPAQRRRQGESVLPARLQPRSRNRFRDDGRRRAGEPADACARPRLLGSQFPDSRARQRRAVLEGTVLRRPGRLRDGGRGQHQLHEQPGRARSSALAAATRASAARSPRRRRASASGHLLAALEVQHNDGPWVARTTSGRSTACCATAAATR